MTTRPTVSVVICAYTEKRWDALLGAIHSVQRQQYAPWEIIVVIDHNQGLFQQVCAQLSNVVVIENRELRGLSGARNSGIARASGDIVAFLDDDAVAARDWLEQLVAVYHTPIVVGVGGSITPRWHTKRPAWFPQEFDWVVGCTYKGMPEQLAPVRNLIGCNMSLRRAVFDTIGGFRIGRVGTLSLGQENDETELCIRVGNAYPSAGILFQPIAEVFHLVTPERQTFGYFAKRCFSEGISKARLARLMGRQTSLSTERAYTLQTLPQGVIRGLRETLGGHPTGLARAVAIVLGFSFTGLGYLIGSLRQPRTVVSTTQLAAVFASGAGHSEGER